MLNVLVRVLSALGRQWSLLASMLSTPIATLHRIARGDPDAKAWWPVLLYLGVFVLIELKVLSRYALLVSYDATTMWHRVQETFSEGVRTDALLLAITAAVLAVLVRLLGRGALKPWHGATAAAFLLVPLAVVKAIGGALADIGVKPVWWLPHLAVDSIAAVVVKGDVDWTRFAAKCAVTYALPLTLAALFVFQLQRASSTSSATAASPELPPPRRRALGAALLAGVLVLFAGAAIVDLVKLADRVRPTLPGDPLPDATLRTLTDRGAGKDKVSVLAHGTGKVLVVDFWASWCNPCRRSMPELSKIYDDLAPQGLAVLAINREPENPKAAAKAFTQIAPSFPSLIDDRFYGDRLGLTTLPTSYVVDRAGTVRHFHMGYTAPEIVRAEVEALLAEEAR